MKIYFAHSRNDTFKKELYEPIRNSSLNTEHTIILPHEKSDDPFNSKDYLKNEADLLIAEVSEHKLGLGIELGWADIYQVPIICIYKKSSKLSGSLKLISKYFVEYSNSEEMILGIKKIIDQM